MQFSEQNKSLLTLNTKLPHHVFRKYCTDSTLFLLYMIGYKFNNLPNNFVNAYIEDEGYKEDFTCPIFVLFRVDINISHRGISWSNFKTSMITNPCYRDSYYVGNEEGLDLIMFVFETPDKLKDDYTLFLEGKFSFFSSYFKDIFPKSYNSNGVSVPILHYQAIDRDPLLKDKIETILNTVLKDDAELWPIPDIYNREVFKRNYINS